MPAFLFNLQIKKEQKSAPLINIKNLYELIIKASFAFFSSRRKERSVLLLNALILVIITIIRAVSRLTVYKIRHFVLIKTYVANIFVGHIVINVKFTSFTR